MTPISKVAQRQALLVVAGGGAGGLELAIRLARRPPTGISKILLIDKSPMHVWKPRLHELAVGIIGSGDDEVSYLAQAQSHGFEFQWGEIVGFDFERRLIQLAPVCNSLGKVILQPRQIAYEKLVIAIGSRVNDFGVEGVVAHCHMLDTPGQALNLRLRFLEAAVKVSAGELNQLTVGIVGAGATGVELAAELHHAACIARLYGGVGDQDKLSITLIDQAPRVLPAADERTSEVALETLRKIGVDVRLGQGVHHITEDAIHLTSGELIPCSVKVWSSGVVGHDLVSNCSRLVLGRGRRIAVSARLECEGLAGVFALGDCAGVPGHEARMVLPPTAQVAHQQAAYLANALFRLSNGDVVGDFRYVPRGLIVSLGDGNAAAEIPSMKPGVKAFAIRGIAAKFLYTTLFHAHRATLYGIWRALALFVSDRLRGTALPPVKLH